MPGVTACATLGWAAFGIEEALRRIASYGFGKVEITELGAYCRHLPFRSSDPLEVKDLLSELALAPAALNVSTSRMENGKLLRLVISDPRYTGEVLEYARWYIDAARVLGAPLASFPIGPRILDEEAWTVEAGKSSAVFRRIVEEAADAGVGMNLEVPHLFQLTDSVRHAERIFEMIDHPNLGATVDSSHWGIIGYNLRRFLSSLGPWLRHVHLRDSAGEDTRDFGQSLELTPGDGSVDFAAFGEELDGRGYAGEVTLELEHRRGDLPAIGREFEKAFRHLRGCGWNVPGSAHDAA
jgi:sugar phosphate isomerase/epimerase